MLCDFYGNVLVPPSVVAHRRPDFAHAVGQLREATGKHDIADVLVAVERTGRYHHPVKRAFAAAGFEVRTVHPFATKQFRQPADPGNKTDDTDLHAIHRCAVNGFALVEPSVDEAWRALQLWVRHRRNLVGKVSALCCQIREHLEAAMPGYAATFPALWEHPAALHLAWKFGSVEAIRRRGAAAMRTQLRKDGVRFQDRTLQRAVVWAQSAACGDVAGDQHRQIAMALDADRVQKTQEIQALERQIAGRLAETPYILLLSIPGINVVSAGDFAGEMGAIKNYANSRCITGRAGLYPSRYQSDEVDRANGPLVRCANRKLRAAILTAADNLIMCNRHFRTLADRWKDAGKDPRHTHVKIGQRFCRIAYHMVAGQQVFHHPCTRQRSSILQKLMTFHREHGTPTDQMLLDLQAAVEQLPKHERTTESAPLVEELEKIQAGRRRRPQPIGEILPLVLAKLGVRKVQSRESGEKGPH
jgi:transposase